MDRSSDADQSSVHDVTQLKRRLGRLSLWLGAAATVVVGWGFWAMGTTGGQASGLSPLILMSVGLLLIGMIGTVIWYGLWRCPECRRYLGNILNPRFCHRCGVKLSP